MTTNVTIQKRSLGQTGIQVTPIGLGVMEFAGSRTLVGSMFPVIPQEEKNAIIQAALDGGINWFDTAEMYGSGVSEQSLAAALKTAGKSDDEVVIETKWMPLLRTADNIPKTIADRQRFLDGYTIDVYLIHQPWSFSTPEAEMDAMAELVQAGKIRAVGVSNFDAKRMRRAHAELQKRGLPLAVNQMRYSLLDRSIETNGVLDAARELGVTIVAYTPLGSGILTGKHHKNPELLKRQPLFRRGIMRRSLETSRPIVQALEEIGAKYNATAAQVALNWVIHGQGEMVVTIPGATKVRQAQESAGAMLFRLSEEEIERLNELSKGNR